MASNLGVSARRNLILLAVVPLLLVASGPRAYASSIDPSPKELLREMQRRPVLVVPARVGWNTQRPTANLNLSLERYGPQATARAVRASLKVALLPDPVAMASLIFCALCWRWIKLRKEQIEAEEAEKTPPAAAQALPEAA